MVLPTENAAADAEQARSRPLKTIALDINGERHTLTLEPRRTLLDALRVNLGLTGTKKVCAMGDCGACTVHLSGEPVYSCLCLAVECEGESVVTIEGLAEGGDLDPVQSAFIEADAFQCGFCTPGQIMSMKALLSKNPAPTDEEIMRAVSGNLCRCGAYRHILEAGRIAARRRAEGGPGGA